ncbi:MAG: hypothetical protein JWP35_3232 [Caulobacter sp.]|nr:hypothetical protein [Caulobacter sp.]
MRGVWRIALAALALMIPALAQAAPEGPKPLFAGEEVIHITIKAPISTIIAARVHSDAPVEGSLTLAGARPETLPIKLSVRGLTRRKTAACTFPPLRLEFTEKPGPTSLFAGQKKLKLVTHCRPAATYEQDTLVEYSAYRVYNVVTPFSYRVRLAQVDYVDADGKVLASKMGFFIEDTDDVAKRNGLAEAELGERIAIPQLSARDGGRAALFEYMIGNLDWAMNAGPAGDSCCHNFKLIAAKGATSGLIPLPYDYDFTGLVDAPYAVPPDSIPVASVRVRRYRGFCVHNDGALAAAGEFRAKRAAMLAVFDHVPHLEDGARRKAVAYLSGFFDQIGSDQDVSDKVLRSCMG